MGYTTDFIGSVTVSPPLNAKEVEYINRFSGTRRMQREQGPYFAPKDDDYRQSAEAHKGVTNGNTPPEGQPGLWCQWIASEDGTSIEWDGGEKFYNSMEWMRYIIDHFLKPGAIAKTADPKMKFLQANHVVNGTIEANGESGDDFWRIVVRNNVVTREVGMIVYARSRDDCLRRGDSPT